MMRPIDSAVGLICILAHDYLNTIRKKSPSSQGGDELRMNVLAKINITRYNIISRNNIRGATD